MKRSSLRSTCLDEPNANREAAHKMGIFWVGPGREEKQQEQSPTKLSASKERKRQFFFKERKQPLFYKETERLRA